MSSVYHNEDCLNIIHQIPDNSIDLICTDPPYEIGYNKLSWDTAALNWNYLGFHFKRVLKDSGNLVLFQGWSNVSQTKEILQGHFHLRNWIVWDRVKGRGGKYNFTSTREDILWFSKTENYTFNKIYSNTPKKTKGLGLKNGQPNRSLSNVWTDISPIVPWSRERTKHPTQKPLALIERIITIFSNPGDVVLDCFAGSFTTGVAAKNLNRDFILIEKEKKYFDEGVSRLNG